MITKWLPWKYVVRRIARARGFVDPISVLSRLHQFAEPSEVMAPMELLRAGVVFHARGLMNSSAIQHNLDWIWPYWVERQFDPNDAAFLPRAFSITHVNLTHRNWTAVGLPGFDHFPIVDPRGLLTPYWDGWSIDGWLINGNGGRLIPARQRAVEQKLGFTNGLTVTTKSEVRGMELDSRVFVADKNDRPDVACVQEWSARSDTGGWLAISIRPYNPEGVSFIHDIAMTDDRLGWQVGRHGQVQFSDEIDRHVASNYRSGDVSSRDWTNDVPLVHCKVGMATAVALFRLEPNQQRSVSLAIPIHVDTSQSHWLQWPSKNSSQPLISNVHQSVSPISGSQSAERRWHDATDVCAKLSVPSDEFEYLFDAAIRTLALHMPGEVYPGPYTYKRFWVRDTAFIMNAALSVGLTEQSRNALPHLLSRQRRNGYFQSQEGEWDANGQALWILNRFLQLTRDKPPKKWKKVICDAVDWIDTKRLKPADVRRGASEFAIGLLPAGFSAEHLGPNDYYYWDNYWAVGGLQAAAEMLEALGDPFNSDRCRHIAKEMSNAITDSLDRTIQLRATSAIPAAPERRMDAGAIGSVVASYPLQLVPPDDEQMEGTLDFLEQNCFFEGGFFQDMIHSGINPYLTLHIAQARLRNHQHNFFELVQTIARLASPTGQWPEAIHPRTWGGCMGDGQHVWAAAEWLMVMRNMFVREEADRLLIGTGIPAHWLTEGNEMSFGPTLTKWGKVSVSIEPQVDETVRVSVDADWHSGQRCNEIEVRICGHEPVTLDCELEAVVVTPSRAPAAR